MQDANYQFMLEQQRKFFATGATLPIAFRLEQLRKLKSLLKTNYTRIVEALQKDLHKPETESALYEIILVTKEIDYILKHLKKWTRPRKASSLFPLCWPGRSEILYERYSSVIIIGPWHYTLY